MKRFHVHVSVENVSDSVRFYSTPVSYTHLDVYKRQPVDRGLAMGEEGFPGNALRIGDPLLVGFGVAAGRSFLLQGRTLRGFQPAINLGELSLVLGLNA